MEISQIREVYTKVLENVRRVIVGKDELFTLVYAAMLTGGHILIEDNPGTGKTLLARTVAKSIEGDMKRVQFTPDLMPQDITGLNVYSQKTGDFNLMKGPVFTNILLADEINRATPRTQSSLLEAMEERSVSIDGTTLPLEKPFVVMATENPIETVGTYPLPEALLDRFLIRISMGQLSNDEEKEILTRFMSDNPYDTLSAVVSKEDILDSMEAVKNVFVHPVIAEYIVNIAEVTRKSSKINIGVSPRASLSLMHAAQSFAAISGRDFVTPDDVRYLAPYVFNHRIIMNARDGGFDMAVSILNELMKTVSVPVEDWSRS